MTDILITLLGLALCGFPVITLLQAQEIRRLKKQHEEDTKMILSLLPSPK